ncbi:MAG: Nif3-like dinuclear metal center hexameric protein [Chloroflexota bacterium]
MKREDLTNYLDAYLRIDEIDDYGPQGIQVEAATEEIERVALAVDTAPAVIEAAAGWGADMLLVHHGVLWGEMGPIAGPLGRRVRALIENDIHLYSAHLPLDAHPEVGNNAELARMFGIEIEEWWCEPKGTPLAVLGDAPPDTTLEPFVAQIEQALNTEARVLAQGPQRVSRVAILSGFGADQIAQAGEMGADTFLTGERSHTSYWAATDHNMNVIYAGHYATETVGVKALGRHLAQKFGLEVQFFDFPTGM